MIKLKTEIEIVLNHEYHDMDDVLNSIEEEVELTVGKLMNDMFGNTSNISCNVTSKERIRDSIQFKINMNDFDTIKRMDAVVERMHKLNADWGEEYILECFNNAFVYNFNMHLGIVEGIVEEQERKKEFEESLEEIRRKRKEEKRNK